MRIVCAGFLLTVVFLVSGCGGSEAVVNTTPPDTVYEGDTSSTSLDEAGGNACYLFFKWTEDATILSPNEMHSRIKEIWDGGSGFTGTSGAKDSSNTAIKAGARAMLEAEVAGNIRALSNAAMVIGDECERLAPS